MLWVGLYALEQESICSRAYSARIVPVSGDLKANHHGPQWPEYTHALVIRAARVDSICSKPDVTIYYGRNGQTLTAPKRWHSEGVQIPAGQEGEFAILVYVPDGTTHVWSTANYTGRFGGKRPPTSTPPAKIGGETLGRDGLHDPG